GGGGGAGAGGEEEEEGGGAREGGNPFPDMWRETSLKPYMDLMDKFVRNVHADALRRRRDWVPAGCLGTAHRLRSNSLCR
ncbi:MAG: hypothetical protein WCG92_21870, partial [Hyphomicrobiales bacterium]